ncbi:caskin-1-like isoform X2 [Apis mellifera]|uniref:Caskin-1-like isoform X2 n=1 Tax=Apis mellifera TaxID=7460 RepID=A0A7M7MQ68_APIME|nr:caskin-1-like isoform X2 [Apis mellifera]|eukprot:XP_026299346.1 caskin-1-like isoform X2 [Apis mellifera]
MAITAVTSCLGPPPLPPGKRFLQKSSKKLSSTYRSFRDPAVESWIPSSVFEMSKTKLYPRERNPMICTISNGTLFRSCSEGNLNTHKTSAILSSTSLDKCIQAIYGSWKNLMHLGGMNRPSKAVTQAKKVAPPAVPDVFRHSGSSFGSAGYASSEDSCFLPGSGPGGTTDESSYGVPSGKSPGPIFTHPGFAFPPVVGKYAHAEDQGIDMTQSPGRDSPGSSGSGSGSRHSTASLDSGRASGYHLGPRGPGALASSPRCSVSSLGSHPDRPADLDVVHAWLTELQFEEYFPLFASAGYDLATITRMTPEDLTAIGIKKPNHRKRLKAEIDNLNIGDGLPEHIPGSLEEWLRLLRLEEYLGALHQQGMRSVEDVTTLTWEDLEDIGIVRLGHQKKLLLAIKRVKDIRAGKRIQPLDLARLPPHPGQTQDVVIQRGGPDLPSPDEDCSSPVLRSFQRGGSDTSGTTWRKSLEDAPLGYPPSPAPSAHPQPIEWRPRSFEDGDLTPTNDTSVVDAGGGTLPRPRHCLVRPRPVAKVTATPGQFKSLPRDFDNKYQLTYGLESSPHLPKRCPPSPPRRQSSRDNASGVGVGGSGVGDVVIDCSGPVPTASCEEHHIHHHQHHHLIHHPSPPPPAPAPVPSTPPQINRPSSSMSRSWGSVSVNVNEEHELIASLALQHRNGSDASFKSSSSTESDSLPFANENAGTIKQRAARAQEYTSGNTGSNLQNHGISHHTDGSEPADVLNDIGNMLANLTDELDAMLEEEKRQGLNS